MISRELNATDLNDYYKQLCDLQAGAHKDTYLLVHDEIKKRVREGNSYTELGINQGATLAAALLENPAVVRAYDISLDWYNKAAEHFSNYAKENEIDYLVELKDSTAFSIEETDVLYIDTLHKYYHLKAELKQHAHKVNKYIIFHDTAAQKGLKQAVNEFVQQNEDWEIVTDCNVNVGFMAVGRK